MSSTDLVRTSRDGDQFHYLWASRRALLLLHSDSKLKLITIEGVSSVELGDKHVSDGEYVVDVAEYYGGESFETADSIKYYQLKHTTKSKETPFGPSKLRNTIEGFSDRYKALIEVIGKESAQAKLKFIFVSNRSINEGFHESIKQVALGYSTNLTNQRKLELYTGLNGHNLSDFCKLITFDITADDYWEQRNILASETATYLAGSDAHSPISLKELITRKALSESQNSNSINKIDVLRTLNTNEDALFPVKNLIKTVENPIQREQEQQLTSQIIDDNCNVFIIQAEGGVGKTIFASHIHEYLPEDSISIVYDCFGDGDYRNTSTLRHTHRTALVQIANELAAKGLSHPLIPSSSATDFDYIKAFLSRIEQAAEKLNYINPNAILSIVIDAADNAQMAAEEFGEVRSFIKDLIKESFPDNVKLISFCRPYRLKLLDVPSAVKTLNLNPFTLEETKHNLEKHYDQISPADVSEFHRLTSQNPRIQYMALAKEQSLPETLRFFGTNPKSIEDTISDLLEAAIHKIKEDNFIESAKIDKLCESIAILRPLLPIEVLAKISQVPEEQIRSFIADIGGHPIRLLDDYIQFIDEPTETWFRDKYRPKDSQQLGAYITTLKPLVSDSYYVASVLPQLMLEAEEYEDLFDAVLSSKLLPETSSLERRHIEVQRLQFAIKAGIKLNRLVDVAKLSLMAGGESAAQTRQNALIADNLDLASVFFDDNKLQELIANDIFTLENKWLGAKFAYEAQLLSYKENLMSEARSKLRVAEDWLHSLFKQPEDERYHTGVDDKDIVRLFIAHFNIHGAEQSLIWLNKWKPKSVIYVVATQVAQEFLLYNKLADLKSMLQHASNNIYFTLGIVNETVKHNYDIPAQYLSRSFKIISRKGVLIKLQDGTRSVSLHTMTNYLLACYRSEVCNGITASDILSRYMPIRLPYELEDTRGHYEKSIYMLAYALLAKWQASELTIEDIIDADSKAKIEKSNSSFELNEITNNIEKLIPWYNLLANSLLSTSTISDIEESISIVLNDSYLLKADEYRFNRSMAEDIAWAWFKIIITNSQNIKQLVQELFDYLSIREITLLPRTLNEFTKICCQRSELKDFAYDLSQQNFERAIKAQINANEILDDIVEVARAILPLDTKQAESYFNEAIEVSSKIGDENFSRWEALIYHASNTTGLTYSGQPELAYRFARCSELTYKYIYEDHFNWDATVKALVDIHPNSALAIASRWRDRQFGEDDLVINAIGEKLLEHKLISPLALLSLLCLETGSYLKGILDCIQFNSLDNEIQKAVILIVYQYQVIPNPSENNRTILKKLYDNYSLQIDDIRRFFDTYEPDELKSRGSSYDCSSTVKSIDWANVFIDDQLDSQYDYQSAQDRYLGIKEYSSLDDRYYSELHNRLSNTYVYDYIESTLNDPKIGVYRLNFILKTIPDKWKRREAVRECFSEQFKVYCRRHALELFISLRYSDSKLITVMSSISNLPESELLGQVLLGRSESSELLDSDQLFNMVSMISKIIDPEDSKDVLEYGLTLLEQDLSDDISDGEWLAHLIPPDNIEEAYAGYFVSGLASPFLYTRWLNAHAVKVLGELQQKPVLDALINQINMQTNKAFIDNRFSYYSYTALQWLLIAFLKVSNGHASAIAPYIDFFKSNINPDKPHILIRLYSAKILLNLNEQDIISLTLTEVEAYESIGTSNFEVIEKEAVNLDEYQNIDKPEVDSFGIDFGPYWIEPLGEYFGLHAKYAYYEVSLVKDSLFNNPNKLTDNRHSSSIYEWQATNHSHGSAPEVENLEFYRNYHSLMIAADILLNKRPLVQQDWYTFSYWLSKYDFTLLNGVWLSNYRDPTPKRTTEWHIGIEQNSPSWEYSMSSSDFDEHFNFDNDWLPIWGSWTEVFDRKEKSFNMRSSLVDSKTSFALLRSLQSYTDPSDYCLPKQGDDFNIDNGVFNLTSFISESEWFDNTIFEKDPWSASIDYRSLKPTDSIIELMNLSCDSPGKIWFDKNGSEVIRTSYWGRLRSRNEEYSRGTKMLFSKHFLISMLRALDMNLIVSFSGEHRLHSRYGKDKDYYKEFGYIPNSKKAYLITKDGELYGY